MANAVSNARLRDKLKAIEIEAYSIAFFLLQDERLAADAAKKGLLELASGSFPHLPDKSSESDRLVRNTIVRHSVLVKHLDSKSKNRRIGRSS